MLEQVRKRDGRIVSFDPAKIKTAIWKAAKAVGGTEQHIADMLRDEVVQILIQQFGDKTPTVENVQDAIEKVLIKHGHSQTSKAFIIYRKKRQELREAKSALGVQDDMKLSFHSLRVLSQHKLLLTKDGKKETPRQMFERVSKAIAKGDKKYNSDPSKAEEKFSKLMLNLDMVPSTAILRNAGISQQQLSEGFVLPLADDVVSLFDTLKSAALLHKRRQHGFGLGFSFSSIRAKGSKVGQDEFSRTAAGPIEFLLLYDRALHQINPYGSNLAFLNVHHPDIIDFITAKENVRFRNFGISVLLTKEFMKAVEDDKMYKLIDPHTQGVVAKLRARSVLDMIATIAWRTGDPAVVFLDNLNKTPANAFTNDQINATTPTGEHPLFLYEGCFTASINLSHHVTDDDFDWNKLKETIHATVHFLDNAIDVCNFPSIRMKHAIERTRRIGVGVMGWADSLIKLKIPYNGEDALKKADKLMKFVSHESKQASIELAKTRGVFGGFNESTYAKKDDRVRNSARTTIVHSGIVSIIAGCSQGIEPYYAISYLRRTPTSETIEVIPLFEEIARKELFYSTELMKEIALSGSVKSVRDVPLSWRNVFVTAADCTITDHLATQVAFQKHTDNGVSKTINLPANATINEVEDVFKEAYRTGCRSVHIYREGSSTNQLIHSRKRKSARKRVKLKIS